MIQRLIHNAIAANNMPEEVNKQKDIFTSIKENLVVISAIVSIVFGYANLQFQVNANSNRIESIEKKQDATDANINNINIRLEKIDTNVEFIKDQLKK